MASQEVGIGNPSTPVASCESGGISDSLNPHDSPIESPMNSPIQNDEPESPTSMSEQETDYTFDLDTPRMLLAKMIVIHEFPISMVEDVGFIEYSKTLNPSFMMPYQSTVTRDIMTIYAIENSQAMEIFRKNLSRVTISAHMWKTSDRMRGYMAITAHFIDNDWNLRSLMMRFSYVPCPHTSVSLSKALLKCIYGWDTERKLSTLTVDNCSTNDGIFDILISKLKPSQLLLRGKLIQMRCCAHIFNLIAQDGLRALGDGLERVRDCVAFWTATPERLQAFRENVIHLGKEYSKQLVLDRKSRWNSTYLMLSVALEYKDVFYSMQFQEPLFTCAPNEVDWVLVEDVCKTLHLLYRVANAFSRGTYSTPIDFFPLMREIKSSNLTISNMAKSMSAKFNKYWKTVYVTMAIANVFDPRYNLIWMEYTFSEIYGESADKEIQRIKKYCYDLFHEYENSPQASKTNQSFLF